MIRLNNIINKLAINKLVGRFTQKEFIAVIVSFLLFCIIFYFIFLPGFKQSRLLSKQLKEKKTDLTKAQIPTGEYELLDEQVNKTKSQLDVLKNRLFWEKDISIFLNELTQLAADLPIEFASLKPESPISSATEKDKKDKKKFLVRVPISVTLKGNYDALVDFLRRIEEAVKFIKMDTFSVESDQRNIYRHNIKIKLSIFTKEG